MFRRFLLIITIACLPALLSGCPGESNTLEEELEEGIEEIEDEIDDAL